MLQAAKRVVQRHFSAFSFVLNLGSFIFTLLAFLIVVGKVSATGVAKVFSWQLPVIFFLVAAISLLAARFLQYAVRSVRVRADFRIIRAQYHLKVTEDPHLYLQDIELEIQALRDGVDRYTGRYSWTGSGEVKVSPLTAGDRVLLRPARKWNFTFYDVHFPRGLRKGGSRLFKLHFECLDPSITFEPVLSKVVEEPVDSVMLVVSFPEGRAPKKYAREEYEYLLDLTPLRSAEYSYSPEEGLIKWEITSPTYRHDYALRWW